MQEPGEKLQNSCFRFKRDIRHTYSKRILQPSKYLIIIVNHFSYIDNQFIKVGVSTSRSEYQARLI